MPDLAKARSNLGIDYFNLERMDKALAATKAAVAIYKKLAKERPDVFLPYLASALNNLGVIYSHLYSNLGGRKKALAATEKAIIYQEPDKQHPGAFLPDLAMTLKNLWGRLSELDRREDAFSAIYIAYTIYKELAKQRPDAFLPKFADSLVALGLDHMNRGVFLAAYQAFGEGVEVLSPIFLQRPQFFANLMQNLLQGYTQACEALNHPPDMTLLSPIQAKLEELKKGQK